MQTLDNYNFAGKKAFVRVDFNVPLDENFNITDDTRMVKALPTLKKYWPMAVASSSVLTWDAPKRSRRQILFASYRCTFERIARNRSKIRR